MLGFRHPICGMQAPLWTGNLIHWYQSFFELES